MKRGRTYILDRESPAAPARTSRAGAARHPRGVLSKKQKKAICMLAHAAAQKCGVTGWREIDEWRKREQLSKFGLKSLTEATQDQYSDIKAYFQALAGNLAGAYQTSRHGEDNPKRIARHNLNCALGRANLSPAYAQAICKQQFHCTLDEASDKQLRWLMFTINKRAAARRRKAAATDVSDDNQPF